MSGDENIYPAEVEEVLYSHPSVLEAAVIGVPDAKWGETVKAIVVLKEGARATAEEIIEYCKGRLSSYKKPTSVDCVDQLPRNPSGKVLKTELRNRYGGMKRKRVGHWEKRRAQVIKQIFLLKRKPGMSFEEFKKYYLEVHAPLVKNSFPEIRKYIVNLALPRGKETSYDAVTEIYWDDFETIVKIAKSDTYKNIIKPDEEKFAGSMEVVLTEEYPQK